MVKYPQNSQNSKFAMSLQYHKNEVRDEVDFLHPDKHQSFLQVDFNTLDIQDFYKWYYHYWWTWSSILKILKVTSLQYLYNIWKKVSNGVHFLLAGKHQNFYKLALSFLMKVARNVQSTQNRKLVNVLQYVKKKVLQMLLCSIVMQNIQILYEVPAIFVVICFGRLWSKMHVVF